MAAQKSNPLLLDLIGELRAASREREAPIWRDVADRLGKPRRVWAEVNVSRLERVLDEGDVAVVAGKLLGTGHLTKAVTVAAFQVSDGARERVEDAGGTVLTIQELMDKAPNGEGVRILG